MSEPLMMREAFGKALVEIGKERPHMVVVDADLAVSTKLSHFRDAFPDRFIQVGVAEQNMMGVAAGLAYAGLVPFTATFACFFKRALDQIRCLIAQPRANVKMIGCYAGLCSGLSGKSHQTVQDIAIFRSMPFVKVIAPLDNVEMESVLREAAADPGPVYVRLVRGPTPIIFPEGQRFVPEKAVFLRQGGDITLISTGTQAVQVLEAADILKAQGIQSTVLHVSWLKPLDEKAIIKAARASGVVMTVEEHNVIGGLGSAVSEVLSERYPVPVKRLGISEDFGQTGSYNDLLEKHGLLPAQIASAARAFIRKRREGKANRMMREPARVCS